jgi:hypothetical protein
LPNGLPICCGAEGSVCRIGVFGTRPVTHLHV